MVKMGWTIRWWSNRYWWWWWKWTIVWLSIWFWLWWDWPSYDGTREIGDGHRPYWAMHDIKLGDGHRRIGRCNLQNYVAWEHRERWPETKLEPRTETKPDFDQKLNETRNKTWTKTRHKTWTKTWNSSTTNSVYFSLKTNSAYFSLKTNSAFSVATFTTKYSRSRWWRSLQNILHGAELQLKLFVVNSLANTVLTRTGHKLN